MPSAPTTRPSRSPSRSRTAPTTTARTSSPRRSSPSSRPRRSTTSRSRSTSRRRTAGSGCTCSTTAARSRPCSSAGRIGETYHVGSGVEKSIEEIADAVLGALGKPASLKTIVPDRPGHDRRYLLDITKIRTELGWTPTDRVRAGDRRHRPAGTPSTAPGGSRWRTARPSSKRTGARLADAGPRDRRVGPGRHRPRVTRSQAGCPSAGCRPRSWAGERWPTASSRWSRTGTARSPSTTQPPSTRRSRPRDPTSSSTSRPTPPSTAPRPSPSSPIAVNAVGTANVAAACERVGAHLVYTSTDYVFDGTKPTDYVEDDTPCPTSVYGRTKLAGELACPPGATVARVSWVAGFHGRNIVKLAVDRGQRGEPMRFVDDQRGCPSFAADLAAGLVTLVRDRPAGIVHLTNAGATTWFGLVSAVVAAVGGDPRHGHGDPDERARPTAARASSDKLGPGPWTPARGRIRSAPTLARGDASPRCRCPRRERTCRPLTTRRCRRQACAASRSSAPATWASPRPRSSRTTVTS